MKQEKINLENPAIFKGKDIGLVKKMKDIFDGCKVSPEIVGGLQKNLEKVFPQTYRDIDLKVEPGNKNSEVPFTDRRCFISSRAKSVRYS